MKTITYNEILFRAAEAAGRTRDNLPLGEAALLKSVFALELNRVWTGEDWDDLRQPLLMVALDANNSFLNTYVVVTTVSSPLGDVLYSTNFPMGEVFGVYDQLPGGPTSWQRLEFSRTGDTYTVAPKLSHPWYGNTPVPSTVYVHFQLPCPDLLAITDPAVLAATTLPLMFGNYLALRGAAHLLAADGAAQLAGVQMGLAQSQLDYERTRIQRPAWTKPA
jgi:hypothetical protein